MYKRALLGLDQAKKNVGDEALRGGAKGALYGAGSLSAINVLLQLLTAAKGKGFNLRGLRNDAAIGAFSGGLFNAAKSAYDATKYNQTV